MALITGRTANALAPVLLGLLISIKPGNCEYSPVAMVFLAAGPFILFGLTGLFCRTKLAVQVTWAAVVLSLVAYLAAEYVLYLNCGTGAGSAQALPYMLAILGSYLLAGIGFLIALTGYFRSKRPGHAVSAVITSVALVSLLALAGAALFEIFR